MTKTLKLNHLPVLTWNKLKMNSGRIPDADSVLELNAVMQPAVGGLPEGLSRRSIPREEADAILAAAPEQRREAVVAGKVPAYHPQAFATGLGKEYDALPRSLCREVELFEAAPGMQAAQPVRWSVRLQGGSRAMAEQILHIGEGASLSLIMDLEADRETAGFAGISTKIILERGAKLSLSRVQMLGQGFVHADDIGVSLAEDAVFELNQMELGGGRNFAGLQAELQGRGSRFLSRTCYLTLGDGETDVNYNAVQRGRRTECSMSFDGVLRDRGKKICRGTIDFRRGSAGSAGDEQENVLLLSDSVENQSIPMILCEEEDVEGRHGATIGRLDEQMLFYLETRGIDAKAAEEMMVYARLGTVTREIRDEALQQRINEYIRSRF